MEEFLLVRKIKIIGRNAIERCAPSRSQKHEPNKWFQTSKGVFERRASTGITCNHAFLLPFLYGRSKGKFHPLFRPPIYALSAKKERLIAPEVSPFPFKYALTLRNRPLPSSEDPHFQNEARCTTFLVKMSFICMRMKNDFHIKGWAPTLVLKQRPGATRKWPTCIAKCLFPYRGHWPENFGQTTAQEYKTTSSDWRASLKIAFG